ARHFATMLHQLRGDHAAVREFASESLAIAVEHRFAFWQAGATVMLGWAAAADGVADGAGVVEQGIDAWRATGSVTYRAYSLALLADAHRRCGHSVSPTSRSPARSRRGPPRRAPPPGQSCRGRPPWRPAPTATPTRNALKLVIGTAGSISALRLRGCS